MGCNTNTRGEVAWCSQFSPAHFHQRVTRGVRVSTFFRWNEIILIWIFILIWQNKVFMQRRFRDQRNIWINRMIWHYKWRILVSMSCNSDPELQSASLPVSVWQESWLQCRPLAPHDLSHDQVWPGTTDWQRNFVLIKEVTTNQPLPICPAGAMKDIHCIAELSE